jgi:hypothetical protein
MVLDPQVVEVLEALKAAEPGRVSTRSRCRPSFGVRGLRNGQRTVQGRAFLVASAPLVPPGATAEDVVA